MSGYINMVDSSLGRFLWYFMKKHQGKMGIIQNRDFDKIGTPVEGCQFGVSPVNYSDSDIEAGHLGLFPSRPSSQLGPWSTRPLSQLGPGSTRPWVNSALGQLGQVYSACCSITKGDVVHVLICQNVCYKYDIDFFSFFLNLKCFILNS